MGKREIPVDRRLPEAVGQEFPAPLGTATTFRFEVPGPKLASPEKVSVYILATGQGVSLTLRTTIGDEEVDVPGFTFPIVIAADTPDRRDIDAPLSGELFVDVLTGGTAPTKLNVLVGTWSP